MGVYVLISNEQQYDFTDTYGDSAMPYRIVVGVYTSLDLAKAHMEELIDQDDQLVRECGTDPTDYEIELHGFNGETTPVQVLYKDRMYCQADYIQF